MPRPFSRNFSDVELWRNFQVYCVLNLILLYFTNGKKLQCRALKVVVHPKNKYLGKVDVNTRVTFDMNEMNSKYIFHEKGLGTSHWQVENGKFSTREGKPKIQKAKGKASFTWIIYAQTLAIASFWFHVEILDSFLVQGNSKKLVEIDLTVKCYFVLTVMYRISDLKLLRFPGLDNLALGYSLSHDGWLGRLCSFDMENYGKITAKGMHMFA